MEPKRTKYDTNPLDDSVADKAEQSWGKSPGAPTDDISRGETTQIRGATHQPQGDEAPTRRIDGPATSYPSIFIPPTAQSNTYQPPRVTPQNVYQPPSAPPPAVYQAPPMPVAQWAQATHKVAGLGISEKWACILPYFPLYVGLIASIVELLLVPRAEGRTRFHAAQGFGLQLAILILGGAFSVINTITGSSAGSSLFGAAATIFLVISIIRVAQGKPHHITPLADLTKWFNEKIVRK